MELAAKPQTGSEIARLVVLAGVGHQFDMEAPDRFNAEVRGFLRSVQR
jgi:pimeloyl-ACP methyl ester carboxylesterase